MTDQPHTASSPAAFPDGVYRIRGFRAKIEPYKSGKNQGKPKGVFLFHLLDDRFRDGEGRYRLVSQTLGWFPGWSVYEINFKLLAGMSREEFMKLAAERNVPPGKQLEFFNSMFKDTEFEAEVRRSEYNGREYLNVWKLNRRLGNPAGADVAPAPARRRQGPPPGSVEAEINSLVRELGLNRASLSALLEEEFGTATATELDAESRVLLRDLLKERKLELGSQHDGLPF